MKTTKALVKIGYSLGVIIDKSITKKMKLKQGDLIELDVKKV